MFISAVFQNVSRLRIGLVVDVISTLLHVMKGYYRCDVQPEVNSTLPSGQLKELMERQNPSVSRGCFGYKTLYL